MDEVLISADSHVMEDPNLWVDRLPRELAEAAPKYPPRKLGEGFQAQPGGWDPRERAKDEISSTSQNHSPAASPVPRTCR